jgi:hypothetical protein
MDRGYAYEDVLDPLRFPSRGRRCPLTAPMRRALRHAAIAAFCLHVVVALLAWSSWGRFGRGNILVWMDFPASLAFLQLTGGKLLAATLLLGGLQWAGLGVLLTYVLGRSVRS